MIAPHMLAALDAAIARDRAQHQKEKPMEKYRSHKIVEAARIIAVERFEAAMAAKIQCADADGVPQPVISTGFGWLSRFGGSESDRGYYIRYSDGYESWSPSKAFEEGYTPIEPEPIDPEAPSVNDEDLVPASMIGGSRAVEQPAPQIRRPRRYDLDNARALYNEIDEAKKLLDALRYATFRVIVSERSVLKGKDDFEETIPVPRYGDEEFHAYVKAKLIEQAEASVALNTKTLAGMGFDTA